jgi:sirohydrochlorin ferrochelatase
VAVAHGSKDPRSAVTIAGLLDLARSRAAARVRGALDVRGAFLDHCPPSLADVLDGVADAVLVPLLLTAAYHSKSDIPAQVAALCDAGPDDGGPHLRRAATLGPHPLLIAGLERRLSEALAATSSPAGTSVVLAAAGSSDPQANTAIADLAAQWQAASDWQRVVPAFASAAAPSVTEAVRGLHEEGHDTVVVATYLLAPGYFASKIAAQALEAGATAVSEPLGAIPEVADVMLARYCEALLPRGTPSPFDPLETRLRLSVRGWIRLGRPGPGKPPGPGAARRMAPGRVAGEAARSSRPPAAPRPSRACSLALAAPGQGQEPSLSKGDSVPCGPGRRVSCTLRAGFPACLPAGIRLAA